MRNGIMYGNAAMLDGLIDRMEAELGEPATLVATGACPGSSLPPAPIRLISDADSPAAGPSESFTVRT